MKNGQAKNTGFIALHRAIQEHWIWDDPIKLKWWLDILMTVNHTDTKVSIQFEMFECKRAQSLNSLQTWAKRWRVDVSTVRRFFNLLKNDEMITIENVKKTTRLTVCNYDSYNGTRHATQSQDNRDATATQSRRNTNNNDNNEINNEKNEEKATIQNSGSLKIEDCVKTALEDSRWAKASGATRELLGEFNEYLVTQALYTKNLQDYKSHFANWLKKKTYQKQPASESDTAAQRAQALRDQKAKAILGEVKQMVM